MNEPLSGSNQLLMFDVKSLSEGKQLQSPGRIDEAVKHVLSKQLEGKRHIVSYLPRFVSWKDSSLVLAVGGATSPEGDGPMTPYCFGLLVNNSTLQVQGILPAGELKTRFGADCQISP
ncbi:hypothetical protein ACFFJT_02075 [Dyella flava]|uniref:Uncharacterized protein n=1 Tax=Dyella flava TaxID=1920170 RepID=A0ABS2K4P8_9GAMM|nr:hypothetical protein [Dyella flava]MBM7126213.1 hypothetical protein [Dyella flava]